MHCYIISRSDATAIVSAFTNDVGTIEVPIVDVLIVYQDEMTGNIYYLIARNVLYVESMNHNLIPPFILREAGLIVNERAKIHTDPDTVCPEDHSIIDPKSGLHIQMELDGTFSCFWTRAPTTEDTFQDDVTIVNITSGGASWDPHSSHYGENENTMVRSSWYAANKDYASKPLLEEDLTLDELESLHQGIQVASTRQADREAMMILRSELDDPTFNGPSETFTEQIAETISSCADTAPVINEPIELPSYIGRSPDMADEYDINIDAVAFTQAVNDYEAECKFKSSIGSVSCHNSNDVYNNSPFEENDNKTLT